MREALHVIMVSVCKHGYVNMDEATGSYGMLADLNLMLYFVLGKIYVFAIYC